jgi:hypothetical protein
MLVSGLSEIFGKEISDNVCELYFRALADLSIEQVEHAVNVTAATCKFFPKPAELREIIEGKPDDQSVIAWEVVLDAYKKANYYRSILFEDGAIGSAINAVFGGWPQCSDSLAHLSDEMVTSKRKEFYTSYRNARRLNKSVRYLPGQVEIENRNTISTWTRDQFGPTYKQQVYIARSSGGYLIEADFDRSSGALIGGEQSLLAQAPQKLRLPERPMRQLTDGSQALDPEQAREILSQSIGDLTARMRMPSAASEPLRGKELLDRIEMLKRQAKALSEEPVTK